MIEETEERMAERRRREAAHNARLFEAAQALSCTGLRLSSPQAAEGVVVVLDEIEQVELMDAVLSILSARPRVGD